MKENFFNINDLANIIPNSSSNKHVDEGYIRMSNVYRLLFTKFIIEELDLKRYDEMIGNSGLEFKPINKDKMDAYQLFSSDELKYLYIRNNIYIERLSSEEYNYLRMNSYKSELTPELTRFIEKTYSKVIFEDMTKNGEECKVFFGPNLNNFMMENDTLVLGLRYDEFYNDKQSDDEWNQKHYAQNEFLTDLIYEIESKSTQKLSKLTRIIQYNESSTILKSFEDMER